MATGRENLEKYLSFLAQHDDQAILLRGGAALLRCWIDAVKGGHLRATPEELAKTRRRVADLEWAAQIEGDPAKAPLN